MQIEKQKSLMRIIMTALTVFLLTSGSAVAMGHSDGERGDRRAKLMQYLLNLTDEQVAKRKAVREAHRDKIKESRKKLVLAHKTFREKIDESMNEDAIREAFAPVSKAMENAAVQHILMMREMKEILTSQQAAKMEEIRDLMPRGPRMGRFFGHGGPPEHEKE